MKSSLFSNSHLLHSPLF